MKCEIFPLNTFAEYGYVIVLSHFQGKILLSRKEDRSTWETQGGHVEAGETPLQAAQRELFEESGATAFHLTPLCDYRYGTGLGQVFSAEIQSLGEMPPFEMAEIRLFDVLPENLTYPAITPELFAYLMREKNP